MKAYSVSPTIFHIMVGEVVCQCLVVVLNLEVDHNELGCAMGYKGLKLYSNGWGGYGRDSVWV